MRTIGISISLVCVTASPVFSLPGLSPVWERLYNNNQPFSAANPAHDPAADPDGDGVSNLRESIAGTDPFSGNLPEGFLCPRIAKHPYLENAFEIVWPSQVGKTYQLYVSEDLVAWTLFGDPLQGTNYDLQLAISPEPDEQGALPRRLFWRVVVGDLPAPGGPYNPWEMDILATNPAIHIPPGTGGGSGGTGPVPDPNSDGAGPTDLYDAAPTDNTINWNRLPEARYLWIPADGQGKAIDMNDQGKILFSSTSTVTDHDTQAVGEVWDPFKPAADRREPVLFRPTAFELQMWKASRAPTPLDYDAPDEDDAIVKEAALWPPPEGDPSRHASAQVVLRAISDDGSVMADVFYSMAENFNGASEAPSRFVAGNFVFAWKKDAYGSCKLLGDDRGFQENIGAYSRNHTAGFYTQGGGATPQILALVSDHPTRSDNSPTPLTFRGYDLEDPGILAATFPGQTQRPQNEMVFSLQVTRSGRVLFSQFVPPASFQYIVAGNSTPYEVPLTTPPVAGITDMPPAGGGAPWGLATDGQFQIWNGNGLSNSPAANGVLQFDKEGTGIGSGDTAGGRPGQTVRRFIWRNTRWMNLAEATNLPAATFNGLNPKKITSSGLIWLSNSEGTSSGVLVPVTVKDNAFATGTDDESIKAERGAGGYQDKFWIMAPCGDDPGGSPTSNETEFHLPLASTHTLGISAGTSTPNPASGPLAGHGVASPIAWHDGSSATAEPPVTFQLSGQAAQGHPVGVKAMKRRTIKIVIQPVGFNTVTRPSKQALDEQLGKIFGWQLNAWPDVHFAPDITYNGDTDGDSFIDLGTSEGAALIGKGDISGYDIKIILSDGQLVIPSDDGVTGDAFGYSYPAANTCLVAVNKYNWDPAQQEYVATLRPPNEIIRTFAHEIGHIMIGSGHPDQGAGPAPLDRTMDHSKRLMCSGTKSNGNSILLLKTEWDSAEIWLQNFPDKRN